MQKKINQGKAERAAVTTMSPLVKDAVPDQCCCLSSTKPPFLSGREGSTAF